MDGLDRLEKGESCPRTQADDMVRIGVRCVAKEALQNDYFTTAIQN
jgi:hypothetical protein